MAAKSSNCWASQSTLAPVSDRRLTPPSIVGIAVHIQGLLIPLILFITKTPPLRRAPVLPADTMASASLFLTILRATTIEESVFLLIATTGFSSFVMT